MPDDIGFSPISVAIKANKLSKTKFHEIVPTSEAVERCRKIFDYEKNTLQLDRSNQSIGLPPSLIHTHEAISYAAQIDNMKNSYAVAALESQINNMEMLIRLMKPSILTLFTNSCHVWTYEYLNSFGFTKVYLPNDENLFRLENILEMQECPFDVYSKQSVIDGNIPQGTDMLIAEATEICSYLDLDIVDNIINGMKSGSVIVLYNINDHFSYYANNDEFDESKNDHPIFDINESIKNNNNCYCYHVGMTSGFSVIIKK